MVQIVLAALVACQVTVNGNAVGQEKTAVTNGDGAGASNSGIQVIQRNARTGEIVPVPGFNEELLQEFLRRAQLQAFPPLYRIDEVQVQGTLSQGLAEFDVRLQIQILRDNERVAVPIGFDDLQLRDHSHRADSPGATAHPDETKLPEKQWVFFGGGLHHLNLQLVGSIRPAPNGGQRISLESPQSGVSSLKLRFAEAVDAVALSTGKPFQLTTDAATKAVTLETWDLSGQTEITWNAHVSEMSQSVVVQAASAAQMTLDLTTVPASLLVRQPLSISGGGVSELVVSLPEGFRQVAIDGTDAAGNSIVRSVIVAEDEGGEAVVHLNSAVTGAITLNYDLGLKDTAYPQEIHVRIPDVSAVTNETADLEIFVPRGLEFERPREQGVRSKRVETSRDTRTAALAYRLLSGESRVDLRVSESESFFAAAPQISFTTEQDQILKQDTILVTARFSINVIRGSLNELTVRWPDYLREGWQILAGDTRLIIGDTSTPVSGFASPDNLDEFTVVFPERQSGQFEVELQGFRDLSSFLDSEGLVFLPEIDTPTPHSTVVSLIESDAYSMYLSSPGQQTSFPVLPSNRWPESLKVLRQPLTAWLVDSTDQSLQIRVTPQKPEVRTRMLIAVSVANESFHIREHLSFDVRYRDLSEIRLSAAGVAPTVRLKDDAEPLERTAVDGGTITYSLPASMRGEFELVVDYNWAPADAIREANGNAAVVPVILPDTFRDSVEEVIVGTNIPEVLVLGDVTGAEAVYSEDFAAAWSLPAVSGSLPIVLKQPLAQDPADVPQFVVVTSVAYPEDLLCRLTAVYDQTPSAVFFRLDRRARVLRAEVDGQPVAVDRVVDADDTDALFQIRTSHREIGQRPSEVCLVLSYPRQSAFGHVDIRLPSVVGVEECNVVWLFPQSSDQVVFPAGHDVISLGAGDSLMGRILRSAGTVNRTAADFEPLLSPYPPDIRDRIYRTIDETAGTADRCEVVVGDILGTTRPVYVLSRSSVVPAAAAVALFLYILILRLRPVPLLSIAVVLAAVTAVVLSSLPTTLQSQLIRFSPLPLLALAAAGLQRSMSRSRPIVPEVNHLDDGSTIFVVEPTGPQSAHGGRSKSAAASAVPAGSGLSVST
ncbi:MAG: hypothetical protein KDA89_22395 [Planctomycetaceae bacterium]|nr:hypothetical protein [Planctomycetaceae bacterium]